MGWVTSDNYATKEHKPIFDGCFCLNSSNGIWTAAMGEQIGCIREPLNVMDRYAVALKKDGALISHLPKKYCKFVHCLSEVEEQLSVLSQA